MTTIEHIPETLRPAPERPVFLAENGRRARIVRIVAKVAVVLTVLWLAALAAGMVGFGQLPGTSIEQPFSRLINGGGGAPNEQAPSTDLASVTGSGPQEPAATRGQTIIAKQGLLAGALPVRARARSPRRPRPAPAAPVQPSPGQAPVAQQPRQQGWTRRGYVAPPGQIRKAEPPAPAPTPPGNANGQVKRTTPQPPPPPPPGNGNGNGNSGGTPKQL